MTRHELSENLLVALDTLRSRKIRSSLTILGIVIGVTSVIAVAAIIDGLKGYIQGRIQAFGSRSFFITRIPPGFTGLAPLPQKVRIRKYLDQSDARYLKENVDGLDVAAAFANRIDLGNQKDSISYGGQQVQSLILRGTEPDYAAALPLFTVAEGRYISPFDEEHARNVAVIGNAIADSLFPNLDPVGKQVRLNRQLYEIIGVFAKDQGLFGGFGVDQFPRTIRDLATDYLHFMEMRSALHRPAVPLLREILVRTKTTHFIDLCSGGGGPVGAAYKALKILDSMSDLR